MSPRAFHLLGGTLFAANLVSSALSPLAEAVPLWLLLYGFSTLLLGWVVLPSVERPLDRPPDRPPDRPRAGSWSPSVASVLLWSTLLRLPLLGAEPSLSDDLYRYVWEGEVVLAGSDPYDLAPDSPELAGLAATSTAHRLVNHRELPALYPAGAQWVFAGAAALGLGPLGFRSMMSIVDLILCALLLGLAGARAMPRSLVLLYAWHPLTVVEVVSSGHFDVLAMLPLALGLLLWERQRVPAAMLAFGFSISVKWIGGFAGVFALAALRRGRAGWRPMLVGAAFLLTPVMLLSLPFSVDGSLPLGSSSTYGLHWTNHSGVYSLLVPVFGTHPARWICVALGGMVFGAVLHRRLEPLHSFLWLYVGMLFLSPVVHPWYTLWLLVLVPFAPSWGLFMLVSLAPLSYLAWTTMEAGGDWVAPGWSAGLCYGLPALLLGRDWVRRRLSGGRVAETEAQEPEGQGEQSEEG